MIGSESFSDWVLRLEAQAKFCDFTDQQREEEFVQALLRRSIAEIADKLYEMSDMFGQKRLNSTEYRSVRQAARVRARMLKMLRFNQLTLCIHLSLSLGHVVMNLMAEGSLNHNVSTIVTVKALRSEKIFVVVMMFKLVQNVVVCMALKNVKLFGWFATRVEKWDITLCSVDHPEAPIPIVLIVGNVAVM